MLVDVMHTFYKNYSQRQSQMTAKIQRGENMVHKVKKVSFELNEPFLTIR